MEGGGGGEGVALSSLATGNSGSDRRLTKRQLVSRGAMMHQLGKIRLRRGQLTEARSTLQQSLDTYIDVYGTNAAHINVAAVHHQLGNVLSSLQNYPEASQHFHQALHIRCSLLPEDHPDVLSTHAELAHCEQDCGNLTEATRLWQEQGRRVLAALESVQKTKNWTKQAGGDSGSSTSASDDYQPIRQSAYVRQLLDSLYSRRLLAKRCKETTLVAEINANIAAVRRKYSDESSATAATTNDGSMKNNGTEVAHTATTSSGSSSVDANEVSAAVCSAVLRGRTVVRQAALALAQILRFGDRQQSSTSSSGAGAEADVGSARNETDAVRDLQRSLPVALESLLLQVSASTRNNGDEGDNGATSTTDYGYGYGGDLAMIRACRRFCGDVEALLAESMQRQAQGGRKVAQALAQGLFQACDGLRADANKAGLVLED